MTRWSLHRLPLAPDRKAAGTEADLPLSSSAMSIHALEPESTKKKYKGLVRTQLWDSHRERKRADQTEWWGQVVLLLVLCWSPSWERCTRHVQQAQPEWGRDYCRSTARFKEPIYELTVGWRIVFFRGVQASAGTAYVTGNLKKRSMINQFRYQMEWGYTFRCRSFLTHQ